MTKYKTWICLYPRRAIINTFVHCNYHVGHRWSKNVRKQTTRIRIPFRKMIPADWIDQVRFCGFILQQISVGHVRFRVKIICFYPRNKFGVVRRTSHYFYAVDVFFFFLLKIHNYYKSYYTAVIALVYAHTSVAYECNISSYFKSRIFHNDWPPCWKIKKVDYSCTSQLASDNNYKTNNIFAYITCNGLLLKYRNKM